MTTRCQGCNDGQKFPFDFSMALQPIVNITDGTVYAHEALVRGVNGEEQPLSFPRWTPKPAMRSTSSAG